MTEFLDRINKLSPKRLALLALEQHEQIQAMATRAQAPIAIVGMACRFPGGANDPQAFWKLLEAQEDAITDVPADRWDIDAYFDADPDAPGRMSVRNGGFLRDVSQFDPAFFGISPREALTMDPQQRLLLEVAWEALEDAALAADSLAGSATGVFVGVCNGDHFQRLLHRGPDAIDAYIASGSAHSVAAGRISYCLGLQGPALAIDTACSSSLVALHVACRSLRTGESRVALAAGVNVMCSPETTIALSKGHMLAPDGRCKTFDARADGFARGEGCGVLVLKRLEDAQADGDRILSVIRGTATNQDGRSGGLTVPNGPAQEAVIRSALKDASLLPADIDYVEAHGTGTSLGDPIEVRALAGALGTGRDAGRPLMIGSVKTNIGHLESAAGIAGVIKVVLALQHERIPAHLHYREPSPHIDWASYPVSVTSTERAWARGSRRRFAGVSSFGFSGTNAHVILEEAPVVPTASATSTRPMHVLPLSARSDSALRAMAAQYAQTLAAPNAPSLTDVAQTAGSGRSHFNERLAVVAASAADAREALKAFVAGGEAANVRRGSAIAGEVPEVVFLFTGQGSQYPGMGQALYDASPVFCEIIDRCDTVLGADAQGRTLKTVLNTVGESNAPVHETAWTQPALFAVEYGIAELWRSWGIVPAAVIGHSVGEYVAACVAGVFSLEDGLRLIAHRGRLMQALPPGGAMAAIFAPASDVADVLAPVADRVAIAAINAADSVVVSGTSDGIDEVLAAFAKRDIRGHRLFISLAGHSPLVEPALDEMQSRAAEVTMLPPRIPVAWNLTGGKPLPSGSAPDAVYWRRHLREPVRFAEGIESLYASGYRTFLEVGPHPTLIALAQRSLPEHDTTWLPSLRRGKADWTEILSSLGALYVQGAPVNWQNVNKPYGGRTITLPSYPFERQKFWVPPIAIDAGALRRTSMRADDIRSLRPVRLPASVPLFEIALSPTAPAWLGEHRVHGVVLAPGPLFLALAHSCAAELNGATARSVADFTIRDPLVLPDEGRVVQVHLEDAGTDGSLLFTIRSNNNDGVGAWKLHATGRLFASDQVAATFVRSEVERSLEAPENGAVYYEMLKTIGITMGPAFQSVQETRRQDGAALARITLDASLQKDAVAWVHPVILDGALQAVGVAVPRSSDDSEVYLLTGVEQISVRGPLPATVWCHATIRESEIAGTAPAQWWADVVLQDEFGVPLGTLHGVCLRRAPREALLNAMRSAMGSEGAHSAETAASDNELHYGVQWEVAPLSASAASALASPVDVATTAGAQFVKLATQENLSVYDELLPALDRLSGAHVQQALRELQFDFAIGRRFTIADEQLRLGVLPRHTRLFARMLGMMTEDGLLARPADSVNDHELEVARSGDARDPALDYPWLLSRFGAVDGELLMLQRCAVELAGVLRGKQDAIGLLFPGGSLREARQLYVDSPYAKTFNGTLVEALRSAIATLPRNATLRVLEIGAGTGGTTTYVLPLLAEHKVEYTFTDISPLFLERASEQFAAFPFVRQALLDIERDPATQGFALGHYDVVIAANVLHATADLKIAVQHARGLLAPGGLLMLLEGVAPERWVDLTFGLTEGWWRFADTALRPAYPLLDREHWTALLQSLDFTGISAIPDVVVNGRAEAQQALLVARAPLAGPAVVLLGDAKGVGARLANRLREAGRHVIQVGSTEFARELPEGSAVVYLGALEIEAGTDANEEHNISLACTVPLRWLARAASPSAATGAIAKSWMVTRGAQRVGDVMTAQARWPALLWGLGRVFALEQPDRWGGLIDLPPDSDADSLANTLFDALQSGDGEDQTAYRGDLRYVARLERTAAPAFPSVRFRADATYVITGGFGGLGTLLARWMVEQGARHLALVGRSGSTDHPSVPLLESMGARVYALSGDLADEAVMQQHFSMLAKEAPAVRGIMHAAAAFSGGSIAELSDEQVNGMLSPKVQGTLVLEKMTRELELDFTVFFSSTTALLGAAGLAHYAAANAFLDATALEQNRPGHRVLSVNWGTWEAMRLASSAAQQSYREGGLEPMAASSALDALGRLMAGHESQAVVAQIDWSVLKPLHEARRQRPFLAHMNADVTPKSVAGATHPGTAVPAASALAERIASAPAGMRHELLVEFVQREVAVVLGVANSNQIPLTTGLFDLGMDSLMSVELKKRLERGSGRRLPSTLTFNYPHVESLAGFLERELAAVIVAAVPSPVVLESRSAPAIADGPLDALTDDELEARLMARMLEIS